MAKKAKPVKRRAAPEKAPVPGRDYACSCNTLLALVLAFMFMAFAISSGIIAGTFIYWMLVFAAMAFLAVEMYSWRKEPARITKAFLVGIFLLVFDFGFENAGWILGLWQTHYASVAVGVVPVEIMLVCLIGGTAWALYMPRKFNQLQSTMDVLTFAMYGAFGEFMLIGAGLMTYYAWWNSWLAFAAYALTWVILQFVKYRVVKV